MSTQDLLLEALRLPQQSRALLAEKLLESLDADEAFAVSPEWRAEIRRRCDEIDRGTVTLVPADTVFTDATQSLG